jgi:hypothetical protein
MKKMSLEHAFQTVLELLFIILLLYGFKYEKELIKWEQKQIKKIKRIIYNIILEIEKH